MPTRTLPLRPNLDQLKIQADELQRAHAARHPAAAARIVAHHPEMKQLTIDQAFDRPFPLAAAQLVIAREYGFQNWPRLKHHVELGPLFENIKPHPRFAEALQALDAGDVERLREILASDPSVVNARTNLEPPYGYFSGATLLHHLAGNPGREAPLPGNAVDLARVLLDAGADVNAVTLGPNGGDIMGLLCTSKQASDQEVTGPMIDLLLQRGAALDVTSEDCLDSSLKNHAPRAAEKMIELGARPDLLAAAALGRMDLLRQFFGEDRRLLSRPRRAGKEMDARDAVGLALLYAYVREQHEAVDFLLEKDGNWNMTGVNNGAVLHRAAIAGDLPLVQRLVAKGADVANRDNPFGATPLSWADHGNQTEVFNWLRGHCAIDLHDAVSFDLPEHVEARLREDPASVNRRVDHWDIPQGAALHWAAWHNREALGRRLLEAGADPNVVAGNGLTPLDVADASGASAVATLLEQYGGIRTTGPARPLDLRELEPFERITSDIVRAYRTGEPEVLKRVGDFFGHSVTWERLRGQLQRELGKPADADVSRAEIQTLFARMRGFKSWTEFAQSVARPAGKAKAWALPLYSVDAVRNSIEVRGGLSDSEWEAVAEVMVEKRFSGLDARGQMTDAALDRISKLDHVTRLNLGGSKKLTDSGLKHLARMSRLEDLDLSDYPGGQLTDRGLEVLRDLKALKRFQMCWYGGISDSGASNLRFCEDLESVNLLGTHTGDGLLAALAGKRHLSQVRTGQQVTDAGLPLLHEYPIFKVWSGGEMDYSLMSPDARPNHLLLDGPFTNRGIAGLVGLQGLFALSFFWHVPSVTPDGLRPLTQLPKLRFLGCQDQLCDDTAMRHISAIPTLRMLMGQGTVATDDGFTSLSRSQTLEYMWGRECPNLGSRGFAAMATMPALRGLAVSCKGVDDDALSVLPRFPALDELMPMDVPDAGFRHIGGCQNLKALWCMYCRDTTDAATEHIRSLKQLKSYYAGQTKITDRSLQILGTIQSLETLEFWGCAGITNAGVAALASLPHLRGLTIDGSRQVTREIVALFGPRVRVKLS